MYFHVNCKVLSKSKLPGCNSITGDKECGRGCVSTQKGGACGCGYFLITRSYFKACTKLTKHSKLPIKGKHVCLISTTLNKVLYVCARISTI